MPELLCNIDLAADTSLGFYSVMFEGMEQKERSGYLSDIWDQEPFKAKWSILAKAYSLIRDNQGKKKAPLYKFLAINGPLIGIIKPDQYLRALSYELVTGEGGENVMRRQDKYIDPRYFITNTSVNDLLLHSYRQGYFTGNLSEILLPDNGVSMTMASLVQPVNQLATSSHVKDHNVQASTTSDAAASDTGPTATIMMDTAENTTEVDGTAATVNSLDSKHDQMPDASYSSATSYRAQEEASVTDSEPTTTITTTVLANPASDFDNMTPVSLACYNALTTEHTESEQNTTTSAIYDDVPSLTYDAPKLQSQWPHNTEFDPDLTSITPFDPFLGNQFNVFEMSDAFFDDFLVPDAF